MTPAEQRALSRAAVLLLVSGLVRWGWEVRRGPPVVPPGKEDEGPRLLAEARALQEEERRGEPLAEGERLDPNRAPEVELDRLPGVGPATARAIVETRETKGGFGRPEELLEVRGIGPATLEKIRPFLELDGTLPVGLERRRSAGAAAGALDFHPPVALNRADESELQTLPGIGPALAARIVAERERRGGFRSAEDLLEVRGIGPATLERIRARIVVR